MPSTMALPGALILTGGWLVRTVLLTCAIAAGPLSLAAFSVNDTIFSSDFDDEIAPADANLVRATSGGRIGYIKNNAWVRFADFDLGAGPTQFSIEVASPGSGNAIEVRLDSPAGPLIGTLALPSTGSFTNFQWCTTTLPSAPGGMRHLYLKFLGGGSGYLFDTRALVVTGPYSVVPKAVGYACSTTASDLKSSPSPQANGQILESITHQSWIAFTSFDLGEDANRFTIEAASAGRGGRVEIRLDSPGGELAGAVDVRHTGGELHFQDFDCVLTRSISGTRNLYLRFIDTGSTGGSLFKTKKFKLWRELPPLGPDPESDEDADGTPGLIEYALGMHPESADPVPFSISRSPDHGGYELPLRLRADETLTKKVFVTDDLAGPWREISLFYSDGTWSTDTPDVVVSSSTIDADGLHHLRLVADSSGHAFFARLSVSRLEGRLHVYPPVPGLGMTPSTWASLPKDEWTESPYYTYHVQKLSLLNHANPALATNWETPFAFFTRCVDYNLQSNAYFDSYIGGWSHTYCNFELDPHTPVIVKIHRRTVQEMAALGIVSQAPKGPITHATAYPSRKVDSCRVINGDVYVTLRNPALIAVDIDRQMDGRDAPRNLPTGFGDATFPFRSESAGTHAVTIFANPFIDDKPDPVDTARVRVVQPGEKPPVSFSQPVLYFAPGVHRLSVDASGNPREWSDADRIAPLSGKTYYIPGDALVYGNFCDGVDNVLSQNIRIYGHGTISGAKIPHYQDFAVPNSIDGKYLRLLSCDKAENVVFEGLTLANPPAHTVAIIADNNRVYAPNRVSWCKTLSWRVNNDGITVQGNGTLEDSFIRHQDDGTYVRGVAIRRTTYWTDVNGHPFRCSFITSDRDSGYPAALPRDLVVEDCDILYARAVFTTTGTAGADRNGIIAGFEGANATYADGTENTGQHLVFRNLTVSDPRPQRMLLAFLGSIPADGINKTGDWRGLRFENIRYLHRNTWGWPNTLLGDVDSRLRFWTFKKVLIGGVALDDALLANPAVFKTQYVSDLILEP
jgi:Carbohydrate binding module (family 6)